MCYHLSLKIILKFKSIRIWWLTWSNAFERSRSNVSTSLQSLIGLDLNPNFLLYIRVWYSKWLRWSETCLQTIKDRYVLNDFTYLHIYVKYVLKFWILRLFCFVCKWNIILIIYGVCLVVFGFSGDAFQGFP